MSDDDTKPERPQGQPLCHPGATFLWTTCGWEGHPGVWACSVCATPFGQA